MAKEYIDSITYALLLMESPMMNSTFTKEALSHDGKQLLNKIESEHKWATSIGNDNFYQNHNGAHIYYHHNGSNVVEYSQIGHNNVQGVVSKNYGNVTRNHDFMRHHILTHGAIISDADNSPGSRNMWINFVKKNPDLNFQARHINHPERATKIDASNIDAYSPKIWGNTMEHKQVRISGHK